MTQIPDQTSATTHATTHVTRIARLICMHDLPLTRDTWLNPQTKAALQHTLRTLQDSFARQPSLVHIPGRPYKSCKNISGLSSFRCPFDAGRTVVENISTRPAWSGGNEKTKPVPHDLVRRIRFWRIKSPGQDFKYVYWTISKILFWNLFTCKGTCMMDWVGRSVLFASNIYDRTHLHTGHDSFTYETWLIYTYSVPFASIRYGVATISRLLKIMGLFCRIVCFIGLFCRRDLWF